MRDLLSRLPAARSANDIPRRLWSSYVGRNPTIKRAELEISLPAIDAERDREPWVPVGAASDVRKKATPGFVSSTFHWLCRLAIVEEKILTTVWAPFLCLRRARRQAVADLLALLDTTSPRLASSPPHLTPQLRAARESLLGADAEPSFGDQVRLGLPPLPAMA